MAGDSQVSDRIIGRARSTAHPSLALIKYWGKQEGTRNLPATPSLAVTLDTLTTETEVTLNSLPPGGVVEDVVVLEGAIQDSKRFEAFFAEFRRLLRAHGSELGDFSVSVQSSSNFPSAAGLASSASGFAALSCACISASELDLPKEIVSALARMGSASAARSLFGGFTRLNEGSEYAEAVHDENWWPDFRIIVLELEKGPKDISSRDAMEHTRLSSPFYSPWLADSREVMRKAVAALSQRNMDVLGPLIRSSYMRMFATMLAADPPVIYWKPISLEVIKKCEELRRNGLSVWETMDAGPQLKLFCQEKDVHEIQKQLSPIISGYGVRVCRPGGPPHTVPYEL